MGAADWLLLDYVGWKDATVVQAARDFKVFGVVA